MRVLESRARKQVRRPQVPRSARSVSVHKIHQELGELGLEVDMHEQVSQRFFISLFQSTFRSIVL